MTLSPNFTDNHKTVRLLLLAFLLGWFICSALAHVGAHSSRDLQIHGQLNSLPVLGIEVETSDSVEQIRIENNLPSFVSQRSLLAVTFRNATSPPLVSRSLLSGVAESIVDTGIRLQI